MTETPMIFCAKDQKMAPALAHPVYPGALGQRIQQEISEPAWSAWLERQTRIINENHLQLTDPETRRYLTEQMTEYLFGNGGEEAQGYQPPPQERSGDQG